MTLSKDEKQQKLAEARKKVAQRIQDLDTSHQQFTTNVNNAIATTQAANNDLDQAMIKFNKDQVSTIGEPSSSCCSIH